MKLVQIVGASPEITATAEARQRASEQAAERARFLGLKKLKGSEKQVAWAETIRSKFIEYAEACACEHLAEKVLVGKEAGTARFWIDNRAEIDFKDLLEGAQ